MEGLSRRGALAGGAYLLVLGLTGCTGDNSPETPAAARTTPPTRDERQRRRLAEGEAGLLEAYAVAVAAFPDLTAQLTANAERHRAHLDAIGIRPEPAPAPTPSATPSGPTSPPPDRVALLAGLLAAENAQAELASRVCGSADDPQLARLTASIAGCETVHAGLLPGA